MDYTLLQAEITTDPRGRGFASMTDAEAAADLTAENISSNRIVSSHELLAWAGQNQRYVKILDAINTPELSGDIRNVAHVAVQTVSRDGTGFNPDNADHLAIVDALIGSGIWEAADKISLLALATKSKSWAQLNNWLPLLEADVARVR